jgi:hypothetical protein
MKSLKKPGGQAMFILGLIQRNDYKIHFDRFGSGLGSPPRAMVEHRVKGIRPYLAASSALVVGNTTYDNLVS